MADKNEEQYLDGLLDSLMTSNSDEEMVTASSDDEAVLSEILASDEGEKEVSIDDMVMDAMADEQIASDSQDSIEDFFVLSDDSSDLDISSTMTEEELKSLEEMDAEYDGKLDSAAEITDDLLAEIDGLILDDSMDDMTINSDEAALNDMLDSMSENAKVESESSSDVQDVSKADEKGDKKSGKKGFFAKIFGKKKKEVPENVSDMADIKANNNVDLINAVYSNVDSLDNVSVDEIEEAVIEEKPKKEKKKKEPKPKKEKKPKPKKEKKPKQPPRPSELVKVTPFTFIKMIVFVAVVVCAVYFGANTLNYVSNVNSARTYYDKAKYDLAYDKIAGLELKEKDIDFYNKLRTIMCVYVDYCAYNGYMSAGMIVEALDSLITALVHYDEYYAVAEEYEVLDEYNAVKNLVVAKLNDWGISEESAREYLQIDNEEQYKEILQNIGGVSQ